eukprot:scaffold3274_cov144-Skeletonema_menzelii.AAC.1
MTSVFEERKTSPSARANSDDKNSQQPFRSSSFNLSEMDKSEVELQAQPASSSSLRDEEEGLLRQQRQRRLRRSPPSVAPLQNRRIDNTAEHHLLGSDETSSSVEPDLVVTSPLHHQQQLLQSSPLLEKGHSRRRLTEDDELSDSSSSSMTLPTPPTTIGEVILTRQSSPKKRTLVVYSGPTSLDRSIGKNDVYLANFDYFIEHGIECDGLGGTDQPRAAGSQSQQQQQQSNLEYVIVLTQPVADEYTSSNGLITQKQYQCGSNAKITVLVREDRCYDMESLLLVSRTFDVPHDYDHMVYINCGLAGPKFGPGSPEHWENLSSWTELYTSLLSDKIQMVGHTINTHFNSVYSPHVQSFLFAINTPMIDIWLKTGAVYECGITNEDFKDDLVKMALVWRYEVGISRVLLERGHSIAAAFMHQQGRIGEPLIIDGNSTFGRHFNQDEIIHSDVFLEDGVRRLTESSFPEYDDHRKYAILPWDCYVFFKVSRLIPTDIQQLMHYENLGPVKLVQNDARRSSYWHWRRKAGVSIFDALAGMVLGDAYHAANAGALRCHGRNCEFDEVSTATGGILVFLSLSALLVWYFVSSKNIRRRIQIKLRPKRTKDQKRTL